MAADKTPSDINSPDQDSSSRQSEAPKAPQQMRKDPDRLDLSRMSPKEIAAELARRSQSGSLAAPADQAPAKVEPFAHITQAVGPTYEERQRLKEQYVKERYRKDEEMNGHDREGGFERPGPILSGGRAAEDNRPDSRHNKHDLMGGGLNLRDHDRNGHDLSGWAPPHDDFAGRRSTSHNAASDNAGGHDPVEAGNSPMNAARGQTREMSAREADLGEGSHRGADRPSVNRSAAGSGDMRRRNADDRAANRAERSGDDLFADRWMNNQADRVPEVHRVPGVQGDRGQAKPDRPAAPTLRGDLSYAAETAAQMSGGQTSVRPQETSMAAPQPGYSQMSPGQMTDAAAMQARMTQDQSSHQQWFREQMASVRADATSRIDRPASDHRPSGYQAPGPYVPGHQTPDYQSAGYHQTSHMSPVNPLESDYLSLDHTVLDRSSYDEDGPDSRYDGTVDPDTGLASGTAVAHARWADLRADDLDRPEMRGSDMRGPGSREPGSRQREKTGARAFRVEPPRHVAWSQPAPRIRWERGIALLLILAALVIGPAIYFSPWLSNQWAQLQASNPVIASIFGRGPAVTAGDTAANPAATPSAGAATTGATQSNPSASTATTNAATSNGTTNGTGITGTETSGTASLAPAGNPAAAGASSSNAPSGNASAASKTTATAEPPAAPMTPLPTTPTVTAQPPTTAQPSVPVQSSTTATAPKQPNSATTDFDTAAGVTEVTPKQPIPTQPTTESQPAGQQLMSSTPQSTAEKDLKQKSSSSSTTARKHLSLEPSAAWLKAQPYNPDNNSDDPSALSNANTPDAWMKARPYDPGVLTAPGQ